MKTKPKRTIHTITALCLSLVLVVGLEPMPLAFATGGATAGNTQGDSSTTSSQDDPSTTPPTGDSTMPGEPPADGDDNVITPEPPTGEDPDTPDDPADPDDPANPNTPDDSDTPADPPATDVAPGDEDGKAEDDATDTAEGSQDDASALSLDELSATTHATSLPSGLYIVRTKLARAASLDIPGGSTASGANVQIWSENNSPAQRFYFKAEADGYYTISNLNSGKVLDVTSALNRAGANVQQWVANGSAAQKWKVVEKTDGSYVLMSKLVTSSGKPLVLDVTGANSSNGANVQLYTANASAAQSWTLTAVQATASNGVYTLTSGLLSSRALDIYGGSYSSGGNAQIWTSNTTAAQKYQLTYDKKTGYYTLRNANSGLMLDVNAGGSTNGSNVQQWVSNGSTAQKWSLIKNSDKTYTLRSAVSGLVLDVKNGSTTAGTNVHVWESNDTAAQKWKLASTALVTDGLYTISCASKSNVVLDVSNASQALCGNIQLWTNNNSWAQKFAVNAYGNTGYYTIRNLNSGMLIGVAGGSSTAGANVDQYTGGPSATQLWKPSLVSGGLVWTSKNGLALDVASGVISAGTNVQAWTRNNTAAQKFRLVATGATVPEGIYTIGSSLSPNAVVDIPSASTSDGTRINLWESNNTAAQKFYISSTGGGYYRITSLCSNKSLDVPEGRLNASNGSAEVQQWAINTNTAQQWRIAVTSKGYFTLYSKCGNGKSCLTVAGSGAANGTSVGVLANSNSAAQLWTLKTASSSIEHRSMNMTLQQQASWQDTNYHTYAEYYNALNPDNVATLTVFADLRGYSGLSASQLNTFLASTANGRAGTLRGKGQAFVTAAKATGLNEAYLLSHAVLESAWGTSELAKGYKYSGGILDGTYYPAGTYYNYYGIGAYDSSPLSGGRKLAIINGWTSPEKAITGGAQWIANNYTYGSYPQYTLYDMRFDTLRSNATGARGWHQYATSLTWMNSIATLTNNCYSSAGITPSLSYIIPKYR